MTCLRHFLVRRLAAALIAASIGTFVGEPLLADVHEASAAVTILSAAPLDAATAVSPADVGAPEPGGPDRGHHEGDGHRVHVCHEAHTHAASLTGGDVAPSRESRVSRAVSNVMARPASWSSAPLNRPPIG